MKAVPTKIIKCFFEYIHLTKKEGRISKSTFKNFKPKMKIEIPLKALQTSPSRDQRLKSTSNFDVKPCFDLQHLNEMYSFVYNGNLVNRSKEHSSRKLHSTSCAIPDDNGRKNNDDECITRGTCDMSDDCQQINSSLEIVRSSLLRCNDGSIEPSDWRVFLPSHLREFARHWSTGSSNADFAINDADLGARPAPTIATTTTSCNKSRRHFVMRTLLTHPERSSQQGIHPLTSDNCSLCTYVSVFFPDTQNASSQEDTYRCQWADCDKEYVFMDHLVRHVNEKHVRVGRSEVEYRCQWEGCPRNGKGFNARYKMLIHIRTHTNEKPHKCPLCGKCFSRLENLKIHNRSHTGEKPYLCPVSGCDKAYSNSSDRFKHVRTHQEKKPYICKMPGCSKRYTDPSSLRKHVRTHGHYFRRENRHLGCHKSVLNANTVRFQFNALQKQQVIDRSESDSIPPAKDSPTNVYCLQGGDHCTSSFGLRPVYTFPGRCHDSWKLKNHGNMARYKICSQLMSTDLHDVDSFNTSPQESPLDLSLTKIGDSS